MNDKPKKAKVRNPPEPAKPWDIAPILEQGDPDPTRLWTAVGMALTAWEKLDQVQANLFGLLVGSRMGAASEAYGTIIASASRATISKAAAEVVLKDDDALLKETLKMLREIGETSARRGEIAHGIVSHYSSTSNPGNGEIKQRDHGHFLVPPTYAVKYRSKVEYEWNAPVHHHGRYAYTAAQVEA